MLLVACFVVSAYLVLDVDPEVYLLYDNGLGNAAIVVASIVLGMYFQDMYSNLRVRSRTLLVQQICTATGVAFLLQSLVNYVSPGTMIPRWLMLVGSMLGLGCLVAFRLIYSTSVVALMGLKSVLFLGRSETVWLIARQIQNHPELGFVMGYLDDAKVSQPDEDKLLGGTADLMALVLSFDLSKSWWVWLSAGNACRSTNC